MDISTEFLTERVSSCEGKGNRHWPDKLKAQIVSETFEPGVTVNEVAKRYGLRANHLSSWRSQARDGKLVLPALNQKAVSETCHFTPLEVQHAFRGSPSGDFVEVLHGEVTVRLASDIGVARVAELVFALNGYRP